MFLYNLIEHHSGRYSKPNVAYKMLSSEKSDNKKFRLENKVLQKHKNGLADT